MKTPFQIRRQVSDHNKIEVPQRKLNACKQHILFIKRTIAARNN